MARGSLPSLRLGGVLIVVVALLLAACGGGDGELAGGGEAARAPQPRLSLSALAGLVVQSGDLPDFFTAPEFIQDFPLPNPLEFAVDAEVFVAYADRADERAQEFLISGVARIVAPEPVSDFFADPDMFLRAALADIGRDLETVRIVPLEELGDDAVGVVYFPGGRGRQDIIIFRRGGVIGYIALFRPVDVDGFVDIGRAAAVMDERIAAALRAAAETAGDS